MYEVVNGTPSEILTTCILFMGACIVTPFVFRLIISAIEKGVNR